MNHLNGSAEKKRQKKLPQRTDETNNGQEMIEIATALALTIAIALQVITVRWNHTQHIHCSSSSTQVDRFLKWMQVICLFFTKNEWCAHSEND